MVKHPFWRFAHRLVLSFSKMTSHTHPRVLKLAGVVAALDTDTLVVVIPDDPKRNGSLSRGQPASSRALVEWIVPIGAIIRVAPTMVRPRGQLGNTILVMGFLASRPECGYEASHHCENSGGRISGWGVVWSTANPVTGPACNDEPTGCHVLSWRFQLHTFMPFRTTCVCWVSMPHQPILAQPLVRISCFAFCSGQLTSIPGLLVSPDTLFPCHFCAPEARLSSWRVTVVT
jgi:hypothetical protein